MKPTFPPQKKGGKANDMPAMPEKKTVKADTGTSGMKKGPPAFGKKMKRNGKSLPMSKVCGMCQKMGKTSCSH